MHARTPGWRLGRSLTFACRGPLAATIGDAAWRRRVSDAGIRCGSDRGRSAVPARDHS